MADPLGFISKVHGGTLGRAQSLGGTQLAGGEGPSESVSFKDVLKAGIDEVNRAQQEAKSAVEDLATGQRSDLEGVVLATQKADNAFRMLQSLRNKMVEAYDEIKQVRV
jgi:flagellar hook-basal body complex protein FliE